MILFDILKGVHWMDTCGFANLWVWRKTAALSSSLRFLPILVTGNRPSPRSSNVYTPSWLYLARRLLAASNISQSLSACGQQQRIFHPRCRRGDPLPVPIVKG